MCALVQQFFKEKAGRKLTFRELYTFVIDNSFDMLGKGKDVDSGWGLFILPNPDTIDIKKYVIEDIIIEDDEEEEEVMKFKDTNGHWADGAIDFVSDKGLLKGYEDGTFKPERAVTRAELATVLARQNGYVEKK